MPAKKQKTSRKRGHLTEWCFSNFRAFLKGVTKNVMKCVRSCVPHKKKLAKAKKNSSH